MRTRLRGEALLLAAMAGEWADPHRLRAQDPAPPASSSMLAGRVLDEHGGPVAGAGILVDSVAWAETDAGGVFRITGLEPGSHTLAVRAIGFEPLALDVRVAARGSAELRITLKTAAQVLEEVVVTTRRQRLEGAGYYARREAGRGRFIEGDSLAGLDSANLMRALTLVRGIHALNPGELDELPRSIACRHGFSLMVNGWEVPDQAYMLRILRPEHIDAVEIYEDAGFPAVDRSLQQSAGASSGAAPAPVSAPPTGVRIRRLFGDGKFGRTSCIIVVWERY